MLKQRAPSTNSPLIQLGTVLWLGLAIALAALILINLLAGVVFSGRVYPGVTSTGLPLAGLKLSQAAALLTVTPGYPENGKVTLTYGDRQWVATPAELGVFTDPQATATTAYKTGRGGSLTKILLDRVQLLRGGVEVPLGLQVLIHSLALFIACMVCHGELAARRPAPRYLTSFYLLVSAGGALGGLLVAVAAPLLLNGPWEYHLAWAAAALLCVVLLASGPRSLLRTLPGVADERYLVVVDKVAATPPAYPRRVGVLLKTPLK